VREVRVDVWVLLEVVVYLLGYFCGLVALLHFVYVREL
jgi:hypothetical protein